MVLGTTSNSHLYKTSEGSEFDKAEFHLAPSVYEPDFYCYKTYMTSQWRWLYLRNVVRHWDAWPTGRGHGHLRRSAAKFKRWKKETQQSAAETQEEA